MEIKIAKMVASRIFFWKIRALNRTLSNNRGVTRGSCRTTAVQQALSNNSSLTGLTSGSAQDLSNCGCSTCASNRAYQTMAVR